MINTTILGIFLLLLFKTFAEWMLLGRKSLKPKTKDDEKINIVITGAAQGLGLELATIFFNNHNTEINLILLDIQYILFDKVTKDLVS